MHLGIERVYPYVGATIAAIAAAKALPYVPAGYVVPKDAFAGVVNASAIGVGFLATMKALVVSMEGRRVISQLRSANYYDYMMGYFDAGMRLCFLLLVCSAPGLLLPVAVDGWARWYVCACVWVIVAAALACYRIIMVLSVVVASRETPG